MNKFLITALIAEVFCTAALAQDLSGKVRPNITPIKTAATKGEKIIQKYSFNFGAHTEFYDNVQNDASGGLRKFDVAPTLGLGFHIPMDSGLVFLPEFNWVLPRSSENSKIIKNLMMFRADFGYDAVDWLRLRVGSSIMLLNQHARGGSTQVNNGNGQSTFYYPDENRSSLNNTLDVGGEVLFGSFSIRLQTYIYSVFLEDRRQISYTLFGTYTWDR